MKYLITTLLICSSCAPVMYKVHGSLVDLDGEQYPSYFYTEAKDKEELYNVTLKLSKDIIAANKKELTVLNAYANKKYKLNIGERLVKDLQREYFGALIVPQGKVGFYIDTMWKEAGCRDKIHCYYEILRYVYKADSVLDISINPVLTRPWYKLYIVDSKEIYSSILVSGYSISCMLALGTLATADFKLNKRNHDTLAVGFISSGIVFGLTAAYNIFFSPTHYPDD